MPKPSTRPPRSYLVHQDLFGREGQVEWVEPQTPDAYLGMRTAEFQHYWSCAVQAELRVRGDRLRWLEEKASLPVGRASKLIRGHAHLSMRDLQAVEGALGLLLLPYRYPRAPIQNQELQERFNGHVMV